LLTLVLTDLSQVAEHVHDGSEIEIVEGPGLARREEPLL